MKPLPPGAGLSPGTGRHHQSKLGILFVLAGSFCLTTKDATTKLVTDQMPVAQVLSMQSGLIVLVLLLASPWIGLERLTRVRSLRAHALRAGLVTLNMFLFVTGLALLPFSMALTLTFVNPLFVAALAPLLLGEAMDGRRWAAILVGFAGVAVIAWPGGDGLSWAILFPIAGAFVGALRDIATRHMAVTETSASMLFYAAAALTVAGLIGTGGHWRPVDADTGAILALSALAQLVALYLMIEAYRFGEAAVVTPFKYTILVWVVLFDLLIWGGLPAPNVFLGAGIIIASSLYLYDRERHRARIAAPETRI